MKQRFLIAVITIIVLIPCISVLDFEPVIEPQIEQDEIIVKQLDVVHDEHIDELEPIAEPEPVAVDPGYTITDEDIIACAKMIWGEARGCTTEDKKNCIITVCNRCDDQRWPDTIYGCVSQECQYYGYSEENPVTDELYEIAEQVLNEWISMKSGNDDIEWNTYNCFTGDGEANHFYTIY